MWVCAGYHFFFIGTKLYLWGKKKLTDHYNDLSDKSDLVNKPIKGVAYALTLEAIEVISWQYIANGNTYHCQW